MKLSAPRNWLRTALLVVGLGGLGPLTWSNDAVGQQHSVGSRPLGIANEVERRLFASVICTCGCPRESLETCTCDFAHARRDELRELLAQGLSVVDAQKSYASRWGTKALSVPPSDGGKAALWLLPLVGLAVSGFLVSRMLGRWKRAEADAPAPPAPKPTSEGPDAYDQRLDDELRDLDDR